MTKQQTEHWHSYLTGFIKHGTFDLCNVYKSFSDKKASAWLRIRNDCAAKHGHYLTVTSAGSFFFSTDFLYKEDNTWHWVHDCYSHRSDIKLTDKMITEAKEAGICLVI